MGSGKSGLWNASVSRLEESLEGPAAVEDKKEEQCGNAESILPGNSRRLARLALGAE